MRIEDAFITLSEFAEKSQDKLTEEERIAVAESIAVLSMWEVVKDRLLLSLAKVDKIDEGYVRGIRYSLAMIDSIFDEYIKDNELTKMFGS